MPDVYFAVALISVREPPVSITQKAFSPNIPIRTFTRDVVLQLFPRCILADLRADSSESKAGAVCTGLVVRPDSNFGDKELLDSEL